MSVGEAGKRSGIVYGALAALLSFACFATMYAFGKALSSAYHPVELIFWRSLIGGVLMGGWVIARGRYADLKTGKPGFLFLRSIIGTACLGAMFATNAILPLAQATVLFFTSALVTPVLAFFLLGEPVGPRRWAAIFVGYFGVVLIVGAPSTASVLGTVLGLAAAGLQSGVGISLRWLGKTEKAFAMAFYFILFSGMVGAIGMFFVGHMPQAQDVWALLGMALAGLVGQLAISEAYRHAPPAVVSPMGYSSLAWSVLFDLAFWGTVPAWQTLAGGAVIIASNLFILWREQIAAARKAEGAGSGVNENAYASSAAATMARRDSVSSEST